MRIRGVDFVMYQVSDLARAATFYRDVLGLPQEVYGEESQWAEFDCGNVTLSLKGDCQLPETISGGGLALAVDDIHAAASELNKKGVRIVSGPTNYEVCWAMEILDPDGNLVILHKRADGSFGQPYGKTDL
jgi:predicted enzyme related to lactoylglutathione lyase